MSHRIDINKDGEWAMSIALEEASFDKMLRYAELLQYKDVEGHDISEIDDSIEEKLEEIS